MTERRRSQFRSFTRLLHIGSYNIKGRALDGALLGICCETVKLRPEGNASI